MSRSVIWVSILLLMGAAPVTGPTSSTLSPQAEAEIWFKKTYAIQLRAARAADKIALARLLYEKGVAEVSEPYRQEVMLRESRDIAESLGEVELSCKAASAMAGNSGDSLQLRSDALMAIAGHLSNAAKVRAFTETCLQTNDDALAAERLTLCAKVLALADTSAKQTHDPLLLARVHEKQSEIDQRLRDSNALHAAQKRLSADPNDSSASSILGRHLCFVELNWNAGLMALEKSDDTFFQLAAQQDRKGDLAAADAWWDVAEHHTGPARAVARERSVRLYEKNFLAAAQGTDRQRAQDRILECINTSSGAIREYQDDPQLLGQMIGPHYASLVKTLEFSRFAVRTDNPHLKHIYATLQISPATASQNLEHLRVRLRLLCIDEQGIPHVLENWRTLKSQSNHDGVIKLTGPEVEAIKAVNGGGWSPRDAHLAVFVDSTIVWQSTWQLPQHSCWFLDDSLLSR